MKKRLLFITSLPPPLHGVSYLNDKLLADSRFKNSFDVETVKLNPDQKLSELGVFRFSKVLETLRIYGKILRLRLTRRFDVCCYTMAVGGFALFRDIIGINFLVSRRGLVLHVRGRDLVDYKGSALMSFLLRRTFSKTTVIQHSPNLVEDIDWFRPAFKNRVFLPNGVPEPTCRKSDLDQAVSEQESTKSLPLKIILLSKLGREKGVMVLLEALRILHEKNVNFEVTLAGGEAGSLSTLDLKAAIDNLPCREQITYVGPVYGSLRDELICEHDVFVFPTLRESFGNVAVEALGCGLPVVASREGSLPDIIDDGGNGRLFETGNADALADTLAQLAGDRDLLNRMSIEARRTYEQRYTLDGFVGQFMEILNDAV